MPLSHNVEQLLVWLSAGLQGGIAVQLIRRRVASELPVFTAYTILQLSRILLLAYERGHSSYATYYYSYWLLELLSAAMGFAAIHEIYKKVFAPFEALAALTNRLFLAAAAVLMIIAFLLSLSPSTSEYSSISSFVFSFELCVRVLQCGLVAFVLVVCSFAAIRKHYIYGILLGFATLAFLGLVSAGLRSKLGMNADIQYGWLKPISYVIAVAIWAKQLLAVEVDASSLSLVTSDDVVRWNRDLSKVWNL